MLIPMRGTHHTWQGIVKHRWAIERQYIEQFRTVRSIFQIFAPELDEEYQECLAGYQELEKLCK